MANKKRARTPRFPPQLARLLVERISVEPTDDGGALETYQMNWFYQGRGYFSPLRPSMETPQIECAFDEASGQITVKIYNYKRDRHEPTSVFPKSGVSRSSISR